MASTSPVDTVRELWQRFEREGVESALDLVDDDVVYLLQLRGGRVLQGSDEVRAMFAEFERVGVSVQARLDTLEGHGDTVVASGTVRVQRPEGLEESQYHWVFHFSGGRLRRVSVYAGREEALSSLAALDAIGPAPTEFAVEEDRDESDGRAVVRPAGELDIGTAPRLERALVEGRSRGDRVVLDLGHLEFIDSTGLRVVVHAADAARREGWELRLRHGPPAVRRVFEIAGVIDALPFESD